MLRDFSQAISKHRAGKRPGGAWTTPFIEAMGDADELHVEEERTPPPPPPRPPSPPPPAAPCKYGFDDEQQAIYT
eukprot:10217576-Prorocentrum_lima.AAC.1